MPSRSSIRAEEGLENGDLPSLQKVVDDYQRDTGGRVVVVGADGALLADSDPTRSRTAQLREPPGVPRGTARSGDERYAPFEHPRSDACSTSRCRSCTPTHREAPCGSRIPRRSSTSASAGAGSCWPVSAPSSSASSFWSACGSPARSRSRWTISNELRRASGRASSTPALRCRRAHRRSASWRSRSTARPSDSRCSSRRSRPSSLTLRTSCVRRSPRCGCDSRTSRASWPTRRFPRRKT